MTVKDLKEKLEKLPESAVVRFVTDSDDNPLKNFYYAEFIYYLEFVRGNGLQAVYITP